MADEPGRQAPPPSPLSRVRLDELLREVLDRVGEAAASRERLRALLDAVLGIGTDRDLHTALERLVAAACRLTDARYGALGVVGPGRTPADFVTHGLSTGDHDLIGDLPHGRGVLGLLIEDPRPIRAADVAAHPRAYGFPPHHPPMRSFLGVPVRLRDRVLGTLYLAGKRGGGPFTDDDEELTRALAVAAGAAIGNDRSYHQGRRRQRWLEAAGEITGVLLGEVDRATALHLVAERAREVAEAGLAVVLTGDGGPDLAVEVVAGEAPAGLAGSVVPAADDDLGAVVRKRHTVVVEDLGAAARWAVPVPAGPALLAPLAADGQTLGVLAVAYRPGADAHLDGPDVALVEAFAGQAALALARARAQEERELLAVLGEHERTARDLHDVVVQRLLAAGLQLQGVALQDVRPDARARIDTIVEHLDATVRDIRGATVELRTPANGALRAQIRALVEEARGPLGFRPQLVADGPIDTVVPGELRPVVVAVLREALANAARHARATSVVVTVAARPDRLTVQVSDDGVGVDRDAAGVGGMRHLRRRADELGGVWSLEPGHPRGTVVTWTVPL